MEERTPASWEHPYLESLFPAYDYRSPTRPWEIHCRDADGIRNCAWQMKAFHYWWVKRQCLESGEIGLSLGIDGLPFCVQVQDNREAGGHYFCDWKSASKAFNPDSFPLLVASAAIPYLPCDHPDRRCSGPEMGKVINSWGKLVRPGGFLIAAIMDETGPKSEGRSLKQTANFTHTWTAKQFSSVVLESLDPQVWNVYEFDTFRNDMAFDVVLERE